MIAKLRRKNKRKRIKKTLRRTRMIIRSKHFAIKIKKDQDEEELDTEEQKI